jgi:hypothetical protein
MRESRSTGGLPAQEHWPNVTENNPIKALAVSLGKN